MGAAPIRLEDRRASPQALHKHRLTIAILFVPEKSGKQKGQEDSKAHERVFLAFFVESSFLQKQRKLCNNTCLQAIFSIYLRTSKSEF